jgi:hypothetical protein
LTKRSRGCNFLVNSLHRKDVCGIGKALDAFEIHVRFAISTPTDSIDLADTERRATIGLVRQD